jgi:hypothetical protein
MFRKAKNAEDPKDVKALVMREEISNMLKQFDYDAKDGFPLSQADIDFMKTILLPIKAKLTVGLQDSAYKDDLHLNKYQLDYSGDCVKYLRKSNISWAYRELQHFFGTEVYDHDCCCYAEIIIGIILITNTLLLCDLMLEKLNSEQKQAQVWYSTSFLKKLSQGTKTVEDFADEVKFWIKYHSEIPLTIYLGFTYDEKAYFKNALFEALKNIISSRKNKTSIETYLKANSK